jgi:threonine/homoserine/homoserine lactone efflux protein
VTPVLETVAASLVALVFGYIGSIPLAGPIAVMQLSRGARGRFSEALRIGLGAAVAEAIYAGAAFWGYTTLLGHHPLVLPISHGVTAAVLVVLGVRFAFWTPCDKKDERERRAGTVLLGFAVSAMNPTLLVTWGAVVAFLYSEKLGHMPAVAALPFGLCSGSGVALWSATLVAVLRRYEGKVPRKALKWAVRTLGIALAAIGTWSGVQLALWLLGLRGPPGASPSP